MRTGRRRKGSRPFIHRAVDEPLQLVLEVLLGRVLAGFSTWRRSRATGLASRKTLHALPKGSGSISPSSATLVESLQLLQWLRVSMEASSSLNGCTCAFCPPGRRHPHSKLLSPGQENSNRVHDVTWTPHRSDCVYLICSVTFNPLFFYHVLEYTRLARRKPPRACVDSVNFYVTNHVLIDLTISSSPKSRAIRHVHDHRSK